MHTRKKMGIKSDHCRRMWNKMMGALPGHWKTIKAGPLPRPFSMQKELADEDHRNKSNTGQYPP